MALTNTITLEKGADTIVAGRTYKGTMIETAVSYGVTGDAHQDLINFGKSTGYNKLTGGTGNATITGSSTVGNDLSTGGGKSNTLTGGNGNDNLTVTAAAFKTSNNTLHDGNGNDVITIDAAGNDHVTLGYGNDTVYVGGGSKVTISAFGGATAVSSQVNTDTLMVAAGSSLTATVSKYGLTITPNSGSENLGTAKLTTHGYAVDLSGVTAGNGFMLTDTTGHTTLVGTAVGGDTITGATHDTITGEGLTGSYADTFIIHGNENINNLTNSDMLMIKGGATANANLMDNFTASASNLSNKGTAVFNADGHNVNVSAMTSGKYVLEDSAGGATLTGSKFKDTFTITTGGDTVVGGKGADTITETSSSASNTFVYAAGDSTASAMDSISNLKIGSSGDVFEYSSALSIGTSGNVATKTDALINSTTGVATFLHSNVGMHQAMVQIVNSIVHHGGSDQAGEFAFFQVKGQEYLFISDGANKAGSVDAGSTVIHLVGVSAVNSISIDTAGHLMITS